MTPPSSYNATGDNWAPTYSFTSLLGHLATLTRNDIPYGTQPNTPTIPTLATATTIQRRAFELLGQPIPIGLK